MDATVRGDADRQDPEFISHAKRTPTGIAHLDGLIKGGLPSGSTVLLLGELGAGQQEFVYTSAAKIIMVRDSPELSNYFLGRLVDRSELPEKVCYISFTQSRDDVLREIARSFNSDFYEVFRDHVIFKDFSEIYFRNTVVPSSWSGTSSIFGHHEGGDLLTSFVEFMDENAANSLVIIDSVTDLVLSADIDIHQLVAVLRGMQRAAKKWGGLIYMNLTKDILDQREQTMIMDSVDGTLVFEWSKFIKSSKRQRYMYLEKFISILPHLEKERIARFNTVVTNQDGFAVVDTERIG